MDYIVEEKRRVPVAGVYDVIVCGGGPAGFCAAVRAAREGAKTLLLERNGALGGSWTTGLMTWIMDTEGKRGILSEIFDKVSLLGSYGGLAGKDHSFLPEHMKYAMEQMAVEEGVSLLYHSVVCGVLKRVEKQHKPVADGVIVENKSGRAAFLASVIIDASGDGEVAELAGCEFGMGREDGLVQPMSMIALISGLKEQDMRKFCLNEEQFPGQAQQNLALHLKKLGIHISYGMPVLTHLQGDVYSLSVNHEYGIYCNQAKKITYAQIHGRKEIMDVFRKLRSSDPAWKNAVLTQTSEMIGIREGRRVYGKKYVTKEDLIAGNQCEDGICDVKFNVDIHVEEENGSGAWSDGGIKVKPYQIPLGALIAKDVSGLLLAGRLISGDFYAHASYRVGGNAAVTGEASGLLAGLASIRKVSPEEIDFSEVRRRL